MSYIDRMIVVRDVTWSRLPDGNYYVAWTEGGERKVHTFRNARAAYRYAMFLDTTGRQPTPREMRRAEKSLEDLGRELAALEEEEALAALASLEPLVRRRQPEVRIHRHRRRA